MSEPLHRSLRLLKHSGQSWLLRNLSRLEQGADTLRRRLLPAPMVLFRDVTAPWLASALCVAARLRLAEHLAEGSSMTVAALAEAAGTSAPGLTRLIDVLAAHGYFRLRQGKVSHTCLSLALRQDVAGSFAELQGRGWYRKAFSSGHALEGMAGQRSPFEVAEGQHFFDYLAANPEQRDLFSRAMANVTGFCTPYLAGAIVLHPDEAFLDVGGADGELASALSKLHPRNTLAVMDRAPSQRSGAEARWTFRQGDFFESVPTGYGHLCLKNILHDWDDDKALAILRRCREAVSPGGRLTVIECLLPEAGQSSFGYAGTFALDWNVWMTLSGKERSASAYFALLDEAGWEGRSVKPTATPYSLLEAVAR